MCVCMLWNALLLLPSWPCWLYFKWWPDFSCLLLLLFVCLWLVYVFVIFAPCQFASTFSVLSLTSRYFLKELSFLSAFSAYVVTSETSLPIFLNLLSSSYLKSIVVILLRCFFYFIGCFHETYEYFHSQLSFALWILLKILERGLFWNSPPFCIQMDCHFVLLLHFLCSLLKQGCNAVCYEALKLFD